MCFYGYIYYGDFNPISIDEQVQDGISVSNWDFVIATEDSVMIQVQPGMKKYLTKKFSD